ncbi:MAG: hypothetical protein ACREBD_39400 [Blastocatellia bacterium]
MVITTGTVSVECPRPEGAQDGKLGNKHMASVCRPYRGWKLFDTTFPVVITTG